MKKELFDLVYLGCFVMVALVRTVSVLEVARQRSGGIHKSMPKMNLDTLMIMLQSLGLFFLPFAYLFTDWLDWANFQLPAAVGWLGAAIYLSGTWMLRRTHRDLGSNWSDSIELQADHTLVTTGIYAHIRHPMYSAHLVLAIGQCLLLGNWIAGPSFLVSQLSFYPLRMPVEERLLLQRFGEEYRRYMERTGRLLPKW